MANAYNLGQWGFIDDRDEQAAVDGGDSSATVKLPAKDAKLLNKAAMRTESRAEADPTTGADLGAGKGAGKTKKKR